MEDFPFETLVKPVEGHDDLFNFRYDFELAGKALEDQVVTTADNGDIIIEGYAAVWEGDDREGENFAPGAFQEGLDNFLSGQAALCYHHKHDSVLGKVLELREEGKGLWMKARVDAATAKHPTLGTIYEQIKGGTFNGLSTYGLFKRGVGNLARKIVGVDLTEISVTGVPVHPKTSFSVVAGKALGDPLDALEPHLDEGETLPSDEDLAAFEARLDTLLERFGAKAVTDPETETA